MPGLAAFAIKLRRPGTESPAKPWRRRDPGIHHFSEKMDCRVKPGNDEQKNVAAGLRCRLQTLVSRTRCSASSAVRRRAGTQGCCVRWMGPGSAADHAAKKRRAAQHPGHADL